MLLSSALYDVNAIFLDDLAGGVTLTPQGLEMNPGWQVAERELLEIGRLRDDWDGMGAKAPDPETVENAFVFLNRLRREGDSLPPGAITASPRGRIVFSWHIRETYLEAEIIDSTQISFFVEFPDGEMLSGDVNSSLPRDERSDVRLYNALVESSYLFSRVHSIGYIGLPQNEFWSQE